MHRLSMVFLATAWIASCGGSKGAKSGRDGDENSGLGEYVATHGGLKTIGGGDPSKRPTVTVPDGLRLDATEQPVKLDGVLTDWPVLVPAKETIKGTAGSTAMSVALLYDDAKLYVGAEVTDDKLVRTDRFGDGEDHASLILAFPSGAAYEVGLYAGKPGESSGSVRYLSGGRRGREVTGAKIVEAPHGAGYMFEAAIPWSAFPEAATVRVGLRGAARYYQADSPGAIVTILATGQGDESSPATLPLLPIKAEQDLFDMLVAHNHLSRQPTIDVFVDVAGDSLKERVSVYDRFLTVLGPHYLGGNKFFYKDEGGDILKVDVRTVSGRAKPDLIVRRRTASAGVTREAVEVMTIFGQEEEPQTTFEHEVLITSGSKRVENTLKLLNKSIEVTYEPAVGWDAATFHEGGEQDVEPILAPWGPVRSQVYQFDGTRFKKAKEAAQTPQTPVREAPPAPTAQPVAPPPPRPRPTAAEVSRQLLDQYKHDRGIAASAQPRFELEANVANDARPEHVVVIGREIVIFGPGFKDGTAYAFITLTQFADAADIKDVSVRDLTGEGGAEILVRGIRHVTPEGSSETVDQELLFVYEVRRESIGRVFSIETAREQGGKRVQASVQFSPPGRGAAIEVRPDRATGWTERTYPWSQERPGNGQVEPLLLPWGGIPSVRYTWNGSQFVR